MIDGSKVSLLPQVPGLMQYDFVFNGEEKFVRKFGRGFIRNNELVEYLYCIVSNKCKRWIDSKGDLTITPIDAEIYI